MVSVEDYRDAALINLKRSMDLCMEMLDDEDLAKAAKLKWAHALAQTAASLCNIIKAMGAIAGSQDKTFAEQMAKIGEKILVLEKEAPKAPKEFESRVYRRKLRRVIGEIQFDKRSCTRHRRP